MVNRVDLLKRLRYHTSSAASARYALLQATGYLTVTQLQELVELVEEMITRADAAAASRGSSTRWMDTGSGPGFSK